MEDAPILGDQQGHARAFGMNASLANELADALIRIERLCLLGGKIGQANGEQKQKTKTAGHEPENDTSFSRIQVEMAIQASGAECIWTKPIVAFPPVSP